MKNRKLMSGDITISKSLTKIIVKIQTKLDQTRKTDFPIK